MRDPIKEFPIAVLINHLPEVPGAWARSIEQAQDAIVKAKNDVVVAENNLFDTLTSIERRVRSQYTPEELAEAVKAYWASIESGNRHK